jgi:GTPase SAR1 family protein
VYDITKKNTFQNIDSWYQDFHEANNIADKLPILVIGNKCDMDDDRLVTQKEAIEYSERNGFLFIETSARQGNDCQKAFQLLFQEIHRVQSERPKEQKNGVSLETRFDPQPKADCTPCSS